MKTELTESEIEKMADGYCLSNTRMREVARTIREMSATIEVKEAAEKAATEDLKTAVFVMERLVQQTSCSPDTQETLRHAYAFLEAHPFPGSYQDQANKAKKEDEANLKELLTGEYYLGSTKL